MADVTENGLRAAVKALTDVVAPALSATDPLAHEQLKLVVDYLQFVRSRLDFLYQRDRFELDQHLSMARALESIDAPWPAAAAQALEAAIQTGTAALMAAGTSAIALKAASAALAAEVRARVREAASFDAELRAPIERAIVHASEQRIAFERAWYLPLGLDPVPGEVAPLASFFAANSSSGAARAP